jgi:outer membrane protein TolC
MTTTMPERKAQGEPRATNEIRNEARTSDPNDAIARRAYELYEQRGRVPGRDVDDWLQAERDVQQSRSVK